MKRALCLLTLVLAAIAMQAQRTQDFASKFMAMCQGDTTIQCVTVSPKMMEQLLKTRQADRDENVMQAIAKLKSARIITATEHSADCFERAEELLKKNSRRFQHGKSYQTEQGHGEFYSRKNRNGDTVELILLHTSTEEDKTTIVNLTGTLDEQFLNALRTFSMLSL